MSEWDERQLCDDGACVGVVGADGKCTVCGRAGAARTSDLGLQTSDSEDQSRELPKPEARSPKSEARSPDPDPTGDPDWDQRTLCPDGACTGLINADGKCGVCGRSAA
jgi:hypothetical protein